jgi:hypothetical protein
MSIPFPINTAHIPRLGEPFKIMAHFPTVVVQCQCEAKTIICLVHAQVVHTCPACKHRYMIVDEMKVAVGAMRPEVAELGQ